MGRGEGDIVINSDTLMLSSILCSNMALKTGERAVRGGGGEGGGGGGEGGREGMKNGREGRGGEGE